MIKKTLVLVALLLLAPGRLAPKTATDSSIACRAMEVFVAEKMGAMAVIFHQRDKADGPRLGQLLLVHSGEEVVFVTKDGREHRATVARIRSCFGRGLLLFASSEGKLAEKEDFVLRFVSKRSGS